MMNRSHICFLSPDSGKNMPEMNYSFLFDRTFGDFFMLNVQRSISIQACTHTRLFARLMKKQTHEKKSFSLHLLLLCVEKWGWKKAQKKSKSLRFHFPSDDSWMESAQLANANVCLLVCMLARAMIGEDVRMRYRVVTEIRVLWRFLVAREMDIFNLILDVSTQLQTQLWLIFDVNVDTDVV